MTSDSTEGASGGGGGGGGNSYSQRSSLPSPWAQVVRGGGETEPLAPRSPSASPSSVLPDQNLVFSDQLTVMEPQTLPAVDTQPEASEGTINGNASAVKKSAWNKPSANGVVEGSNTPVMGAASWPALSELTRPLPKSLSFSSESSSQPTPDPSVTVCQAPVISQPPQRPARTNASHHSNQNHTHPVRPRSMRRGGGGGAGGSNRPQPPAPPPMPPPYPYFEMSYASFVPPPVLDSPVREQSPYNGNSFAPRPMGGVHDHSSNRRRNNFGPRPRGDGGPPYLNNGHGGRRDHHDRDWRGPRSHAPLPPQMAPPPPPPPRGYMPPAHMGPPPFIAPQPIRPYGTPVGYEIPSSLFYVPSLPPPPPDPYRVAPLLPRAAPPTPMFAPVADPEEPLSVTILKQIEYYFSDANLVKDSYLRSNMDEEGWVPVTLIAGFRRVQNLTNDIQLILNSLKDSTIVEVQGETLRRRNEWRKFLKPASNNLSADSTTQSATDSSAVETSFQKLTLEVENSCSRDTNNTHNEVESSDTCPKGLIELANGEATTGDVSMNSSKSSNQEL